MRYEFSKKDYKKYLKYRRSTTNIIILIIGTLIYFYITYYLLFNNPFLAFIYYILYLFILIIIILLFNELYCKINIEKNKNIFGNYIVTIKEDKIIVNINNKTYEYLNSNIKYIKNNKRYILIKYNNKLSLLFIKELIDSNDYRKLLTKNITK